MNGSRIRPKWAHGRIVIAVVVACCGLAHPAKAEAHGRSNVVALDYEARLTPTDTASGLQARVVDGDRKLELRVPAPRTVVVRGYGGEPFLRFTSRGVEVNLVSPTAVANRLTPRGEIPALGSSQAPRWNLLTSAHRFAWHDHRLGPRAGVDPSVGRVGEWAIPIAADGSYGRLEGTLWYAAPPSLLPWLGIWLLAAVAAVVVARVMPRKPREWAAYVASAACALLVLLVSSGFASASARTGASRLVDLGVPGGIALLAAVVFFLRPARRPAAAAVAAAFAFAAALEDVAVFRHGFVVSSMPAGIVRVGVALALATGAFALLVLLAELWRGETGRARPARPRPQPRLAIPRGRPR